MTDYRRRQSDTGRFTVNLDALFLEASEKKDREFLVALSNINDNLSSNTAATHLIVDQLSELKAEFELHKTALATHTSAEEAWVNKGRGAVFVLPLLFILAQAVVIYLWSDMRADINEFILTQRKDIEAHEILDKRLTVIETEIKKDNRK